MTAPLVGIVMGSASDWPIMKHTAEQLEAFGIPYEAKVLSAHRTPEETLAYSATARSRGLRCIIAGAGGAAHLAGVIASKTTLPVLAVPIPSPHLQGLDSLLSTVQMPKGIPVATFAIGEAGAANAGIFAAQLIGVTDEKIAATLASVRAENARKVLASKLPPD